MDETIFIIHVSCCCLGSLGLGRMGGDVELELYLTHTSNISRAKTVATFICFCTRSKINDKFSDMTRWSVQTSYINVIGSFAEIVFVVSGKTSSGDQQFPSCVC